MAKVKRVAERERFERWAQGDGFNVERNNDEGHNYYSYFATEYAWRGWQAHSRRKEGGK
jgi:hypothetical protein